MLLHHSTVWSASPLTVILKFEPVLFAAGRQLETLPELFIKSLSLLIVTVSEI